ncbi:hypothetical protein HDU96_007829 [Phlyctochytrium bullatum]|nr:hypothetical protein HDU96_007829 [Phlyctochytrium bullatum]
MLIPMSFEIKGFYDFIHLWRDVGYGLPRRGSVPIEFVDWLTATITKALELDVIPKDDADKAYFFALWLGSVELLQFALARLLLRLDPDAARTAMVLDDASLFSEHRSELGDIVTSALHDTILLDDVALVKRFIRHPLTAKDGLFDDTPALQVACKYPENKHHAEIRRALLAASCNVDYRTCVGSTLLMRIDPNPLATRFLLEDGANILLRDDEGENVFHRAAEGRYYPRGAKTIVEYFRSLEDKDPQAQSTLQLCLDAWCNGELTPLMHAIARDNHRMVRFFIESGANILKRDGRGWTAMDHIAEHSSITKREGRSVTGWQLFRRLGELHAQKAFLTSKPDDGEDDADWFDVEGFARLLYERDYSLFRVFENVEEFEREAKEVYKLAVIEFEPENIYELEKHNIVSSLQAQAAFARERFALQQFWEKDFRPSVH